jgi:sugar phosphate isomerase/epimerase
MNNRISFMSANYVARQVDYNMTGGWGQGDRATSDYFRPIETFPERFEVILQNVRDLGFEAMDLWTAHVRPTWATKEHLEAARSLLAQFGLTVPSLAGWFGSTAEEFERSCQIAVALDCPILGGSSSMVEKDRAFVEATLKRYGLRLGLENHPEKTPEELLEKIGDGGEGTIGATVDTGWFGTQGYDAARAIERLGKHVFHVHLKDVLKDGEHETCRFGEGIVPVEACVQAMKRIGYTGAICIEHEPELFDPTEDVRASYALLREWLRGSEVHAS